MGHLAAHEDPGCDGEKPNTTTSTSPGRWQGEGGGPRHRETGKGGGDQVEEALALERRPEVERAFNPGILDPLVLLCRKRQTRAI